MSAWQINVLKVTGLEGSVQAWVAIRLFLAKEHPLVIRTVPTDHSWGCRSPFEGSPSHPRTRAARWKIFHLLLVFAGPLCRHNPAERSRCIPSPRDPPQTVPDGVTTAGEPWCQPQKAVMLPSHGARACMGVCGRLINKLAWIHWNRGGFRMARHKALSSSGSELFILCISRVPAWISVPVERAQRMLLKHLCVCDKWHQTSKSSSLSWLWFKITCLHCKKKNKPNLSGLFPTFLQWMF